MKNAALILFFLLFQACGAAGDEEGGPGRIPDDPEAVPTIPFLTKEPETYQATIAVEAFTGGEPALVRQYVVARKGSSYSVTIDPGGPGERLVIFKEGGPGMVVDRGAGTIRRLGDGKGGNDPARELTAGWLSLSPGTRYERLETSGGIARYRVTPEGSKKSETFVFYDEERKLPVRTEIYSGGQIAFRYEIRAISDEPDPALFETPAGLKEEAAP